MTIEVYTPRWANLLRKLFVGKGNGGQLLQVLDDVLPTVGLVDPAEAEQHWIRDEVTWAAAAGIGAVAAQYANMVIANPAGSGKLIVIERVTISAASAAQGVVGVPAFGGVASNTVVYAADTRAYAGALGFVPPIGCFTGNTAVALSSYSHLALAPTLGPIEELVVKDSAVVLSPGYAFTIQGTIVNTSLDIAASGYIRNLDPGE